MGLAALMILFVSAVFALGAAIALAISYANGQFSDLKLASEVVLSDREPVGWESIKED